MKTFIVCVGLALVAGVINLSAQEPVPSSPIKVGGIYADTFVSLSTPDFSHSEDWAYGVGVGYQFTSVLAADVRITHAGLDFQNNAVSSIGGRVISRLPWQYLSPYSFLGARFDLKPDVWRLQPGVGAELSMSKVLKGTSVFAEAGLDADLKGHNGYLFTGGLRWRF